MIWSRYIILMLFSLALLQSVSAELILNPTNLDFQILDNQVVTLQFDVYNNYTFPIYNVSLTELPLKTTSDMILKLDNQSTGKINVTVQSNEPFQASKNAKLIFFLKATRQESIGTLQVNLTNQGFLPRTSVIIKGSTIKFVNQDSIIHSVTSTSFDNTLNPAQEFSYAYNEKGDFPFHDTYLGYFGNVLVVDNVVNEMVYFPDYAVNFSLNLNIFLHQTDLSVEIMETNLTCPIGIGCETVIRINNPTNVTALNISISGATANKNNFDLNGNTNTFVLLKILPTATTTLETNATRIESIIISGLNFPTITTPVSFFLPYFDLDGYNSSEDNSDLLIQQLRMFCNQFPSSLICNQTRKLEYVNNTEFIDRPLPYNYTQQEIHYIKEQIAGTNTKQEELKVDFNAISTKQDTIYELLINITDSLSIDRTQREELIKAENFNSRVMIVLMIVIVLLVGLFAFYHYYGKDTKEQDLFGKLR